MKPQISPGGELFLRGAKSYLDAVAAISAFRSEAQDMCGGIYKHYASELAAQMGLDDKDCERYDGNDPGAQWAEVGINRPAQRTCFFYLYLKWSEAERVDGVITANVTLGLYHKRLRDEIYEGFRRKTPGCRVTKFGSYGLILSQELKDLAAARDVLDAVVLEWLAYCKSIGGLKLRNHITP